jgi:dTDP-4-amino-4,6-dideoxy-D-galactose acyltransferase
MKNIEKLNWESENFGYPCGQIKADQEFENFNLKEYPFKLIVIRAETEIRSLSPFLVDEKVIFSKKLFQRQEVKNVSSILGQPQNRALLKLAYQAGTESRFFKDTNFRSGEFKILYNLWLENSLNGKIASEVFIIGNFSEPQGFATIKISDDTAQIGLIAVREDSRGQGLGRDLIEACNQFCINNKLKELLVATQDSNLGACAFYKKNDFKFKIKEYIYHWWNE